MCCNPMARCLCEYPCSCERYLATSSAPSSPKARSPTDLSASPSPALRSRLAAQHPCRIRACVDGVLLGCISPPGLPATETATTDRDVPSRTASAMARTPSGPMSLSARSMPTHTRASDRAASASASDDARANASSSSSPRRRSEQRPPFSTHAANASRTKSARLLTRRRPSSAASEAEDTDGLFASAISLSGHPPRVESAAASAATPRSETSLERRLMDSRDGDASLAARAAASASAAPSSRPQPPRLSLLSRVVFLASARASATVPPPSVTGSSSPRSGMSLAATPVSAMCTPSRGLSTRQSSSTAHRSFMRKSASASAPPEHTSAPVRFSVTVGGWSARIASHAARTAAGPSRVLPLRLSRSEPFAATRARTASTACAGVRGSPRLRRRVGCVDPPLGSMPSPRQNLCSLFCRYVANL